MNRTSITLAAGSALLAFALPALAQLPPELAAFDEQVPGDLINDPTRIDWASYGDNYETSGRQSADIPGGGAARVFAVDVGSGQMHARIAADPRVVNLEQTDARDLTPALIPEPPSLIVCDASFIGLAKVLPVALALAAPGTDLVTLVKPQFEATGPGGTKKGVVKDAAAHLAALVSVSGWLEGEGWSVRATTESPITGGDGNIEFLLWAKRVAGG